MKNCITKRILVVALTLVTAFTSVPINAFAEDSINASIETEEVSASLDEDIVVETDSEIESDEETVLAAIEVLEEDPSSEVLPGENSEIVSEEIISEEPVIENKEEEIIPEEEIPSEEVIEEELLDSQVPIEKPELKAMPKAKAALLGAGNTRKATVSYNYSDVTVKYGIQELYITSSGMPSYKDANISSLVPGTYYRFEAILDTGSISNYEYDFQSITVNGVNNIDNNYSSIGFVMPDNDINITINFEKKERVKINFSTSANMNVSYKYKIYDWNSIGSGDNHVGREVTNGMVFKNDSYIIHIYDFDSNYRIESVDIDNNNGYISTCDKYPNSDNDFATYYNGSNQVTIKVNFKANKFDVTIHYLLTNNITDSYSVNADAYFEIPKCTYSFGDYEVIGYKLKGGGDTLYKEGDKILVNQNLYLEAQFDKKKYTIYFNSNNGKNEKISIKDYIDATSKYPECPFENEGYKFIGWTNDINIYDSVYIKAANEEFEFYNAFFNYDIYETNYYALWQKVDNAKLTITSNINIPFEYDVYESDISNNIYDKVTTLPYLKTGKYYVVILRDYDDKDYYPYLADESNPLFSRIDEGEISIYYLLDDINIDINFKEKQHKQPTFSSSVTPVNSGIIEGVNKNAKPGEVLTLNPVANAGYEFDKIVIEWGNNKKTIGKNYVPYNFTVPETNYNISITAYFKQETWNLSTNIINPEGGTATLTRSFLTLGETSFFEAIPNEGWKVKEVSWIYDGNTITCDDQNLKFTARAELSKTTVINVEFERLPIWTINPVITNPEGGTVELSKNPLYEGEVCRITVTPNEGWKIKSETWIEDGRSQFNAGYILDFKASDKIDKNFIFNVEFEELPKWTINPVITNPEGGKVELSKNPLYEGEVCRITVTPNEGWKIKSETWIEDGRSQFNAGYILDFKASDKIDKNFIFNVEFERLPIWTINPVITNPEGGTVELSKNPLYEGEVCRITVTPNEGWKIKSETWIEDGRSQFNAGYILDFKATDKIDKNFIFNVEFARVYKITAISDPAEGGTIKLSHKEAAEGETVNVTVNANPGYKIVDIIPEGTAPFSTKHVNDYTYEFTFEMANKDLMFKVSYENITPFNVTFDANGASGTMDIVKVLPNEEITLPVNTFERDGYSFDGWNINGTSYKAGDKVKVTADTTVKAMWLINAYVLTFDTNYPEANLKPVVVVNGKIHVDTIDFNTEFSIGVNDFDNESYAIDKVLVDNTKVTLTDNSFSYTMPSHDVKIEVVFVKKLSVSFDANGASGSIDSFKVTPNEEITLPANTFIRDGYSFDGWSINDASYKAGEKVKVTSDIVVKANWKVNSYNLTFESNYNEANLKPIVILKGKDFNGKVDFNDEFNLNLNNYDKENYQIVKATLDGDEIDNDLSKVYKMPSHDVKVVVTFVKKLVVTFDANGGKGSIDTLKVMPNDEIKLPKNSFTRSGYTFKGWDIDGKTYKVNDTVVIENDTTIKAKWSKNPDPAPTNDDNNNNNDSNDSGNNDSNSSSDTKKTETAVTPATVASNQAKNTSSKVTTDEAVTSNDNAEEANDSKVETEESKDEETKEVSKSDEEDQPASLTITDDNVPEGNSNTNTDTNEPETDNTDDGISALELVGIISAFIIALLALIVTVSASVRRRRK